MQKRLIYHFNFKICTSYLLQFTNILMIMCILSHQQLIKALS
ncbi:hypothetical protein BN1318_970003 [Staphylococcus capitis]|nr:hypothetical protein BN1318_970003 [Staphylococcus capitis]